MKIVQRVKLKFQSDWNQNFSGLSEFKMFWNNQKYFSTFFINLRVRRKTLATNHQFFLVSLKSDLIEGGRGKMPLRRLKHTLPKWILKGICHIFCLVIVHGTLSKSRTEFALTYRHWKRPERQWLKHVTCNEELTRVKGDRIWENTEKKECDPSKMDKHVVHIDIAVF